MQLAKVQVDTPSTKEQVIALVSECGQAKVKAAIRKLCDDGQPLRALQIAVHLPDAGPFKEFVAHLVLERCWEDIDAVRYAEEVLWDVGHPVVEFFRRRRAA